MTDLRERYADREEMQRTWLDSLQSRLWTALPGVIQSVTWDNGAPFAAVKIAAKINAIADDLTRTAMDFPILPHCPLHFPRGGGFSLTFPVSAGDECLVVFASRSIDEWWQNGEGQPQYDTRRHDLSDGIAFVGLTSNARPQSNISTTSTQLRSDDGGTVLDLAKGAITLTAALVTINGSVQINGSASATGDIVGGGISLDKHAHTGVESGSGTSGPPEG